MKLEVTLWGFDSPPALHFSSRFKKGNPGGPRNPYTSSVALLRNSIFVVVQPDDIEKIIRAQIEQAKQGDTVAAKFILERVLRRPQVIDLALVAKNQRSALA